MNQEFTSYLESLSLSQILIDRVENLYNIYKKIFPKEITGIFVTDFIKEDGTRDFESLWFFSEDFFLEAKLFVTKNDIDIAFTPKINYVNFEFRDYDFVLANENSRLNINLTFSPGTIGDFKASKENCDHLREIYYRFIQDRIILNP